MTLALLAFMALVPGQAIGQPSQETINRQLEAGIYVNVLHSFTVDGVTGDDLLRRVSLAKRLTDGQHLAPEELIDAVSVSMYLQGVYTAYLQGVYSEMYREEYNRSGKDEPIKPRLCGQAEYSPKQLVDVVFQSLQGLSNEALKQGPGAYLALRAFLDSKAKLYSDCR